MEQMSELRLCNKISEQLKESRLNNKQNGQVLSHCKKDHLTPSPFDERKNSSSYVLSHSPTKHLPNYNQPQLDRGLQKFRKYQNSTTGLANLPNISENSSYHNTYQSHSQQKIIKGKEGDSWFLKMKWALDPKSSYQKNYVQKNGAAYNRQNKERVDNNHLTVFQQYPSHTRNSTYNTYFHPYTIKKEAQITINNKDHLQQSNVKNLAALSEYKRKYDSVMETAKPKESAISIYKKEGIVRNKL